MSGWLQHALLAGVDHGFGTRAAEVPAGLVRPRQVHGVRVILLRDAPGAAGLREEADAIVSALPGVPVGVVTADCLPILVATPSGAVAAVHAGWRGLAAGVVAAACEALGAIAPDAGDAAAVIGPHVGRGCYEVDAPVVEALARRFSGALAEAAVASRPGHWHLDLARLARFDLARSGLAPARIGTLAEACTACHGERFYSYRRDGPGAGRLIHYVTGGPPTPVDRS